MLIQCDASQLEWRVLAWLSQDKTALWEINNGVDFHSKNQEEFGLPTRLIAKVYLFRTIYRGSGYAFARDPNFSVISDSPDFWESINSKFYRKYSGIDQCHRQWGGCVAEGRPIISPLGREWLIGRNPDGTLPWTVLTNYPVQGTGHDLMSIARVSLRRRIGGQHLVSTVHDSIVVDCPQQGVDNVKKIMYNVFQDLPKNIKKLWGIDLPCEFPCEIKAGYNLKEMEKI